MKRLALAIVVAFYAGTANAGELIGVDLTPNETFVSGSFTPESQTHVVESGAEIPIGAFRGRDCGKVPNFAKLMEQQIKRGMVVPDGIMIFNAGVTEYNSRSCNGMAKARLIGVRVGPSFKGGELIFIFPTQQKTHRFTKTLRVVN